MVTGKGGTGKTSVAATLSLHLAAGGQNVLLIEVEGRQGIAQLFDVPQLPYEERKVAVARDGGDVFALAIDPEDALYEYLDMYYHLGRAGKALRKVGVVEFATTVAPVASSIAHMSKRTTCSGMPSGCTRAVTPRMPKMLKILQVNC